MSSTACFGSWLFIFIDVAGDEARHGGVTPDSALYSQMHNTQGLLLG